MSSFSQTEILLDDLQDRLMISALITQILCQDISNMQIKESS